MSMFKMGFLNIFILILSLIVLTNTDLASASKPDRVLYRDLGTLYFYPGEMTRARRTHPVPQLVCLKGCQYPQPRSVKCENVGWDGGSNLWRCTAELDSAYSLDRAEVVCEGYNSPDDSYVTAGSCSLEYSIKRKGSSSSGGFKTNDVEPPGLSGLFFILACLLLLYVLYKTCVRSDEEAQQNRSFTNNDGPDDGQGPQMGWNIPGMNQRHRGNPPPYNSQARDDTCGGNNNAAGGGGGPGFWTGLAAGGLLGSMFGGSSGSSGYRNAPFSSPNQRSGGFFESGSSRGRRGSDGWGGLSSGSESTSQSEVTARYRQR
ncbi:Store-operated calcium entry-associated regulatory factor [Frankliniella fusca]|uniref:Store-operated calcium entry-associated regulatory factor n=1 Tax=Frankliniella fusca TaxID=407009 RepID=A0AAE1I5X5_9NEOP|nr:Store-operated calcium entry-associated regulatory factor [Frankliniella fusca]